MSAAKKCARKHHKGTYSKFVIITTILLWFKIKHNKNNRFFVYQCTIAANEPKQVYLTINCVGTILITHRSDIEFRTLKCKKQAPFCSINI